MYWYKSDEISVGGENIVCIKNEQIGKIKLFISKNTQELVSMFYLCTGSKIFLE